MRARNKRVNIGSVSSGTMRPEDLIPDFIAELRAQTPTRQIHRRLCTRIERASKKKDYFEGEDCHSDLEDLYEALNDYAPTGFYFGHHPGDGSDYGYWLSESFLEDFDGPKLSDFGELPKQYTGEFLVVNDHGNVTLAVRYSNGRTTVVWAIV